MERAGVEAWIASYERAWRSPGTEALAGLFTEDAVYSVAPIATPQRGLTAIAAMWDERRDGPGEGFAMTSRLVAVDVDVAVARIHVDYDDGRPWEDLWVMRFADDGRCSAFEEWPFAPGQDHG